MVLPDGSVLDNMEMVHHGAVNYFEQFLSQVTSVQRPNLDSIIQPVISEDSIRQLKEEPTEEEVYEAFSSILVDSNSGSDGFGSSFYLTYWKIVKNDVMEVVRKFFKVLVGKLSLVIGDLISLEQCAFVKGKSLLENVTLTQEMTKLLHRRNCISTTWFSVMMHDTYRGFFKSKRGLRQGDPLSQYIFIIMEEALSRLIQKKMTEKRILPFAHPSGAPIISHLLYADDVVIFVNACKKSVQNLMEVLKEYESWTGQRVNKDKSAIFFSKKLGAQQKRELLHEIGFIELGLAQMVTEENCYLYVESSFECLSVDEKVRRAGVSLASAYDCCDSRQSEDLEHVLNKGEFAVDI
ncbi:hypothetical protein HHK36_006713 [Tetracentron sinense]|uniref:Reverse transcriptase domain-containing protein n=1 Tax=Tetracentron sinense TaxID=13715 RepID=A0A834ZHP4_TETSI|nr:hypothetical protein HHK36_006713 [Tetracentron sinense]